MQSSKPGGDTHPLAESSAGLGPLCKGENPLYVVTYLLYQLSGKPIIFDPTVDGVRQFHVPDSITVLPEYRIRWDDPTILRLTDGRWCIRNGKAGCKKWEWGDDDPHDVFREVEPLTVLAIRNVYLHDDFLEGGFFERLDRLQAIPHPHLLKELLLDDQAAFEARHAQFMPQVSQTPAPSGNEPPAKPMGFQCSKAELLRALGKDATHLKYLDRLVQAGQLCLKDAESPIGHLRYIATFSDSARHEAIVKAITEERGI